MKFQSRDAARGVEKGKDFHSKDAARGVEGKGISTRNDCFLRWLVHSKSSKASSDDAPLEPEMELKGTSIRECSVLCILRNTYTTFSLTSEGIYRREEASCGTQKVGNFSERRFTNLDVRLYSLSHPSNSIEDSLVFSKDSTSCLCVNEYSDIKGQSMDLNSLSWSNI